MTAIEARIEMVKNVEQRKGITKSERWAEFHAYYLALPPDVVMSLMKEIILDGDVDENDAATLAWRQKTGVAAQGPHGHKVDTERREGWRSRERD